MAKRKYKEEISRTALGRRSLLSCPGAALSTLPNPPANPRSFATASSPSLLGLTLVFLTRCCLVQKTSTFAQGVLPGPARETRRARPPPTPPSGSSPEPPSLTLPPSSRQGGRGDSVHRCLSGASRTSHPGHHDAAPALWAVPGLVPGHRDPGPAARPGPVPGPASPRPPLA